MAVIGSDELGSDGQVLSDVEDRFTAEDFHLFRVILMVALLLGGVLLVAFSSSLGVMSVESCSAPGSCSWSPDQAEAVAVICRWIGLMAFVAGLVERVLMALAKMRGG